MSSDSAIYDGSSKPPFVPLEPHSTLLGLSPAAITTRAKELAHFVREYSRTQKETWQKIPWLALQAWDRDSNDAIQRDAFELGFWQVLFPNIIGRPIHVILVDLATGELYEDLVPSPCEAPDELLALLAFSIDVLNAGKIAEMCRNKAEYLARKNAHELRQAERAAFVRQMAGRHNVSEIYTRERAAPRPGPLC